MRHRTSPARRVLDPRALGRVGAPAWAAAAAVGLGGAAFAQPANDACASATALQAGTTVNGTVAGATPDGASDCSLNAAPDVYYRIVPAAAGVYTFSLCGGTPWDSVISVHTACPAGASNQIACDDDGCRPAGATGVGYASTLAVQLAAGQAYVVRIAPYDSSVTPGLYSLRVVGPQAAMGACCLAGVCSLQTAAVCQTAGAGYRGDYTACYAPLFNPTNYFSAFGPFPIPDNDASGVSIPITVPDSFTVADVQVNVQINHSFVGDLVATLSHGGRTATLFSRIGGGTLGDDSDLMGTYSFSDGGPRTLWTGAVDLALGSGAIVTPTVYRAVDEFANTVSLRAVFGGVPSSGPWTLRLVDASPFGTGAVSNWSIGLDASAGDPCGVSAGACCNGSSCTLLSPLSCGGPGRRFIGPGTACNAQGNFMAPCCKGDFNQNQQVTVQDIFDFLAAYFAGLPSADTNGGGLSVQDLFDFLMAYFGGC